MVAGWPSAATKAAASCSESAARRSWTRNSRIAVERTGATGWTSCQAAANSASRPSATVKTAPAQPVLAFEPGQRRRALDLGAPPGHNGRIRLVGRRGGPTGRLADDQWQQGRAIPEPHRPERRSSSRTSTALPLPIEIGSASLGAAALGFRTTPVRSSRAEACIVVGIGADGLDPDDWLAPVCHEDRFAGSHTVDDRAELVLQLCDRGGFHVACIARSKWPVNP